MARKRTIRIDVVGDAAGARSALGGLELSMGGLGRGIGKLVGIAGFAGLAFAMKNAAEASVGMALDFEESMAKIEGLVGINREVLKEWEDDVLRISEETAKAPTELADALFFITSAGIRGSEALEVLEASAKAATAGLGETKVVADAATSAMNAYGPSILSAEEAVDVLVATVREGKLEPAELAGTLGRVLPIASELGVTFDQVGAAVAAMSRLGLDAAESSTALRGVMAGLLKPTGQAEAELAKYGLSAGELRRQIKEEGLLSVLISLKDAFGANEESLSRVFGNVRALTGVLNLVGANVETTSRIFEAMEDNTGDLDKAFQAMEETAGFKLHQAMTKLKVIGTEVGADMLPSIVQAVEDFMPALEELLPALGEMLVVMLQFGATVGPAVAGVTNMIALSVRGLTLALLGVVGLWDENAHRMRDVMEAQENLRHAMDSGGDVAVALADSLIHLARNGELTKDEFETLAAQSGLTEDRIADVKRTLLDYAEAGTEATVTTDELNTAFDTQANLVEDAAGADEHLLNMTEDVGDAMADAEEPVEDLTDDVETLRDRLLEAAEAQESLTAVMRAAADPIFNAVNALTGYQDVLEDVDEDGERTAEEQLKLSEAGFKVAEAFEALDPKTTLDAMDSIAQANGTTREEVRLLLQQFGIFVDEAGNISTDIADGLLVGYIGLGDRIEDKIAVETERALNNLRSRYNIHSPSGVFAKKIGEPIAEGIAQGILDKIGEARSAVEELTDQVREQAEDDLNDIVDSISAITSSRSAARALEEAREDLATLMDEQKKIGDLIDAKARELKAARERDRIITPEEQVEIEKLERALVKVKEAHAAGEATAAEVKVAENELAAARREATGATDETRELEEELNELRERKLELPKLIKDAQDDLTDAQLRAVEAEKKLIESGANLIGNSQASRDAFIELAKAVGLTTEEIEKLIELSEQAQAIKDEFTEIEVNRGEKSKRGLSEDDIDRLLEGSDDAVAIAARIRAIYSHRNWPQPKPATLDRLVREVMNGRTFDSIRAAVDKFVADKARDMAHGGIATGETIARIGEGHDPEAVIPLNERGINFLAEALRRVGLGGGDRPTVTFGDINVRSEASAEDIAREIAWRMRTTGV